MEASARSYSTGQDPKPASISSEVQSLDPVIERIEKCTYRMQQCVDRLTGPRPTGVENAEKAPEPNHLIYAVQSRRNGLARVADWLETEVSRMENGLA